MLTAPRTESVYPLNTPGSATKGGESGIAAIKPGDPLESHLMRFILLPRQPRSGIDEVGCSVYPNNPGA